MRSWVACIAGHDHDDIEVTSEVDWSSVIIRPIGQRHLNLSHFCHRAFAPIPTQTAYILALFADIHVHGHSSRGPHSYFYRHEKNMAMFTQLTFNPFSQGVA